MTSDIKKKFSIKNILKEYWFVPLTAVIITGILISGYRVCVTIGESMEPTLKNGEYLLLDKKYDILERYDIVVFETENDGNLIKRVIGLPGEKVQIIDNVIYINDEPIEDAVDIEMNNYGVLKDGITLKNGEYFCMGDNRNNSKDCRVLGPVSSEQIVGKIIYRIPSFQKITMR